MKGHLVLSRRVGAAGMSLLLLGILMSSLVWAVGPSSAPSTGDTSPVGRQEAQPAAPARTGSHPAPVDPPDAKRAVREAWEKAQDAGTYAFATDLTQVIYPVRTLSNVGRGPERAVLHLAGTIDQPARALEFQMWQSAVGGSGNAGTGAEARIEGERAYVRQAGGEWQEVEDFSTSFAPGNDPLAFLAGVKDVADCGLQARWGRGDAGTRGHGDAGVACYRFKLDGPVLAAYLRDRLERQLSERGELPLGVTLDASRDWREMTGSGELWVDGRGLPLRLMMHLALPEQKDGSHLDADIQTDFSGFPEEAVSSGPDLTEDPVAWAGSALGLDDPSLPAKAAGGVGVLACSLGALAVLVVYSRSRRVYIAVAVAVTLSMVVVPLLQSERTLAFYDRQAERSENLMRLATNGQVVDAEKADGQEAARQVAAEALAPAWDPNQDPLAQAQEPGQAGEPSQAAGASELQPGWSVVRGDPAPTAPEPNVLNCDQNDTADPDNDGVSNFEECVYFTDPTNPDQDNDGLNDGQELDKLGSDPTLADTDGDLITDTVEVQGFELGQKQWYLDPNNADTNGDGLIDSMECPALVDSSAGGIAAACDTDQDGLPNAVEFDNDDDGVPDAVDLSPEESVDRDGIRIGQAGEPTAFNGDTPFELSVTDLAAYWPVFVDLQLRPVESEHLAYAMNVLNWPDRDVEGQIQHGKPTTFKDSNPQDTAGANGDMRLVPLLEIMMTGDQIPLKLAMPAVTVTVGSETAVESEVTLRPGADPASTELTYPYHVGAELKVYEGTCEEPGTLLGTFADPSGIGTLAGKRVVELADDGHALVVSMGSEVECAGIPDVANGPYLDKMVDTSVLEPYGITVKDEVVGGVHAALAYVPLNVTTDDTGGGKSAFQARMLYWVGDDSAWLEPQRMRVIWLVQMLTDECSEDVLSYEQYEAEYESLHPHADDPEIEEAYDAYFDNYCGNPDNRTADQIMPVQVYDESWYMTGLSVREDHGLDVSVAYVNPELSETEPDTYDDTDLWTLSWGLGEQFMTGLDCRTDGTIWDPGDYDAATCSAEGTGDDKRDLTLFLTAPATDHMVHDIGNSTIEQRFDITNTVPITQRWGIESVLTQAGTIFPLVVESFRYDHQDYLGYLAMNETPRILEQFNHGVAPTLLFAREERYREARLEAGLMPGTDQPLTVSLGATTYPEQTLAGLQWTPYQYNAETMDWEAYPTTEYWDVLEVELEARFEEIFPAPEDDEANTGRAITARAYSFALINGVAGNVAHCTPEELLCPLPKDAPYTDDMLIKASQLLLNGLNAIAVKTIYNAVQPHVRTANLMMDYDRNGQYSSLDDILDDPGWGWVEDTGQGFFKELQKELKNYVLSPYSTMWKSGRAGKVTVGIIWGAAAAAVISTIVVSCVMGIEGGQIAAVVMRSISVTIAAHCVVTALSSAINAIKKAGGWAQFHGAGLKANITKAGVISTCLQVVMTWAAFGALVGSNGLEYGSMAYDNEVANAIAATIVTVLLFVILTALGPIGQLVGAVIGLVNAIAGLICSALPEEMQTSEWGKAFCGGITSALTYALKWLFYSGTILVDMDPDDYDRLSTYDFTTTLRDPDDGVVDGNAMRYSVSVTSTIGLEKVPVNWFEPFWGFQFNDDELKKANFAYRLQDKEEEFHDSLSPYGSTDSPWEATDKPGRYQQVQHVDSGDIPLPQAGVNRPVDNLYLSEGYAVPEQECWGVCIYCSCSIQTERSTNHYDIGSELVYDVLPDTLTGFYELVPSGDGWTFAWAQGGHLKSPILEDADGDGLARAGDPDDGKWDADGDGLSDGFELNMGSDPLLLDTDSDGLTDLQEAQLGSDPRRRDSDGDGLLDCQEVYHPVVAAGDDQARHQCGGAGEWSGGWTFVYKTEAGTQFETLVTSDPLDADTDADGLTDRQEQIYGYNPRAYSVLNVLTLQSAMSEPGQGVSDGFMAPDQTLAYSATVKNELDNRRAEGLFWTVPSEVLEQSNANPVKPKSFMLWPQAQATMAGELVVENGAASGTYSLTQVAGALIVDPRVESREASLWLPFDDAQGSTLFVDESGHGHDGRCYGTGCAIQGSAGRIGGAITLNGEGCIESDATLSNKRHSVSFWFKASAASLSMGAALFYAGPSAPQIALLGGRVYVLSRWGDIVTNYPIVADKWYHIVLTDPGYEGGADKMILYLDGFPAASAPRSDNPDAYPGVYVGGTPNASHLNGSIDDLRLFDDVVTPAQVQELFDTPLFHADFDDSSAWKDVSSLPATIGGSELPSHSSQLVGGAADFNGTTYLSVESADKLDLSAGRYTLAAWIYPRTRPLVNGKADARDSFPQGILGLNSGTSSAYPTLQRVGKKIRFSLGTGSAWAAPYTSGDVLVENEWNHVAVTLDDEDNNGTLRLYVNGDLVDTAPFAANPLSTARSFDIGRSSGSGQVSVSKLWLDRPGDALGSTRPRLVFATPVGEVWNTYLTGFGVEWIPINKVAPFTRSTYMFMWHLNTWDKGETCNFTNIGTQINFDTTMPSIPSTDYPFTSCGEGKLNLSYDNNSIPFYGTMDEVQIFGWPLDPDSVKRRYLDIATVLHLPLDEAPGAQAFQDTSLPYAPASCSGSTCPTSGTVGRLERGALFDGVDDSVIVGGPIDVANASFSVAFWARRDAPGRWDIALSQGTAATNMLLHVGFRSNDHFTCAFHGNDVDTTNAYTDTGWHHWACTYNAATETRTIYRDGVSVPTNPPTGSGHYQGGGDLYVGSYTGSRYPFKGSLDDVWVFNVALPLARVTDLYNNAPSLHLGFEEARGARQFADNADPGRSVTCLDTKGCPLTGEAVRGQIGLAAQFDGISDTVMIDPFGTFTRTTVSAWVYRTGETATRETIVSYKEGADCGFVLALEAQQPKFWVKVGTSWLYATTTSQIATNQWVHLAGTYNGTTIRLYQNGQEVASMAAAGAMRNDCSTAASAIGSRSDNAQHYFPGRIDEVHVYGHALTAAQIWDEYLYESAWIEDRQSQDITVDDDEPTAAVLITGTSYLVNQPIVVGLTASDPTSGVSQVKLGVKKGTEAITWTAAMRCAENADQPDGAWCADFNPSGAGDYTLYGQATDRVGHVWSQPAGVTVYVDDTPPDLTLDQTASQVLQVTQSAASPNTWLVQLSGTATDPDIATNVHGSGVPDDGVQVTLRRAGDPGRRPLGDAGQTANLTPAGAWSLDYTFSTPDADGWYEVAVETVDRVALLPGLSAEQTLAHTRTIARAIMLDVSGPQVLLDRQPAIAGGQLTPMVTSLAGAASDRPVPVEVDLAAEPGAEQTRLWLTCQHADGTTYTLLDLAEGALQPGDTPRWEADIQQGSSCQVNLATSAASAEVTGTVKVCNDPIVSWQGGFSASRTIPFAVNSSLCTAAATPAGPGSEPPWAGEVMRLPLDDAPGSLVFPDRSGNGNDAACPDAGRCPAAGQAGHVERAVLFDGTDDYMSAPGLPDPATSSFTVAFWAKRSEASRLDYLVSQGPEGGYNFLMYIADGSLHCQTPTMAFTTAGDYADTNWHHFACTFERRWLASENRWEYISALYADGELRAQDSTHDGPVDIPGDLLIGRYVAPGYAYHFKGALDDMRVLSRALTTAEIRALYIGYGPVLHLPFDTSPATGGTILPDATGWHMDGTLVAGAGDTADKAVPGQVGPYALQFDGANDYVEIPHNAALDAVETQDKVTIAAWAKIAAWYNGYFSIVDKYEATGDVGWSLYTHSSNGIIFMAQSGAAATCAYVPPLNQWVHLAVSYDRSAGKAWFYVNGAQQCEKSFTGDINDTAGEPLYLGYNPSGTTEYSNGSLDEVLIYGRALATGEIGALYGAGWQSAAVAGVQGVDLAFRPVLPGSAFFNEAPLPNEVLHLPFEDGVTSEGGLVLRDVSGAGANGTCTNCPSMGQAGPSDNSARFDGADDHVAVAALNAGNLSGDFTLAGWFSLESTGDWKGLLSKDTWYASNGWGIILHPSYGVRLYINYQHVAGIPVPSGGWVLGRWYHYAFTRTGDTLRSYLDGVEYTSTVKSTAATSSSQPLTVGKSAGYYWPGKLDEVRIFTRALTKAQVMDLYQGPGPVLALPFEVPWATNGATVTDASGRRNDGTLEAGTTDGANKAMAGQVGYYALQFDGVDDYVNAGSGIDLANASFSVAVWAKNPTQQTEFLISQGVGGTNTLLHIGFRSLYFLCNFYGNDLEVQTPADGNWHHWACTYDAATNTQTAYRDGVQVGQRVASADYQGHGDLIVGRYAPGGYYFGGVMDDLRIYRRALPALEVADLVHAGWRAAGLPAGGAGAESTSWTAAVPGGLEGSYQVEMRGVDVGGHTEAVSNPSLLWRGEADNVPPRVMTTRTQVSTLYRYTTVAQDYHLDQTTYRSPCGTAVVPTLTPEYYTSPWYLGTTGDSQKLFRLTAVCELATWMSPTSATICDSLGNCTTCDWSNNCTTSVVAMTAAGNLEAGQEVRLDAAVATPAAKPGPAGFDIIVPAVVTASHYYEPRTIDVAGWVTTNRNPKAAPNALASVEVSLAGETGLAVLSAPAERRPYTVTWTVPWHLAADSELPDGVPYAATITATNASGRTTVANRTLVADVVLPAPVTLSLTADGVPVEPGAIIREPGAALELTWTPSSDGSGLAPYLSGWRFADAYTTTTQIGWHDPAGPLAAQATAGEAQRIGAGLASRDLLGNTRMQAFGSIIVDGPLTPDYIAFSPGAEENIINSTCTLLGADRRIDRRQSSGRGAEQRLYGTWDHQALRLAWTGADWSGGGDLFLYLDTVPGGTSTTFTPYTVPVSDTLVTLPPALQADVLIWVQDSSTAGLLRWDESAWITDTLLSPDQYRFDGGRNGGQTDLVLPFGLLGTTQGASLGLLAFAAEEPAEGVGLRLWATAPLANPVNSDRVNLRRGLAPAASSLPLLRAYRWAALDDGVCPNGTGGTLPAGQLNDAVIEISVESDPPGAAISGLAGGLFWVLDPGDLLSALPAEPRFGFLRAVHPPVPDGQAIHYTVHYRNGGSHMLQGAWLALTARGALQLEADTLDLGDIPPGAEGSVTFQATVDRSQSPYGLAAAVGRLYAAGSGEEGPPLEWLAALHRVDRGAPEEMGLNGRDLLVGPQAGLLRGFARDESGISQVELEITSPYSATSTLICQIDDQASGGWSCPWDATAANGGVRPADGDQFTARLRATDRLGYSSGWSASHTIRVDAQPPTVTLGISPGALVRGNSVRLMGEQADNHAVGTLTVCLGERCQAADRQSTSASSGHWSRSMMITGTLDYVTKTLTIQAADRLGNSMTEPVTVPVVFDNVAPVLTATQTLAEVPLGSAETVLSGEVRDGGPDLQVSVRVQPPEGDVTRVAAMRNEAAWWFDLPADMPGQYVLRADAEDTAGNVTTAGPFTVTVTCTDAAPLVMSVAAEPVAGQPQSVMVTVVISNAGPEALPVPLPVTVSDGISFARQVTTTGALGPGESETLSLVWEPTGATDYQMRVTAERALVMPNGPLCVAPGTTYLPLALRDRALPYGWSLISPPLNPGDTAIDVARRGIDGEYTAILGYDGGVRAYYPDDPGGSDLATVDALHGYWVHTTITFTVPPTVPLWANGVATWRMAGEVLPEDQPVPLAAGWNLAGYLPLQPLTVTTALEAIAGSYGAVLGFDLTAASYYPDLDQSYNTLSYMAPGYGYWISATQAVTLAYPLTGISETVSTTATQLAQQRQFAVRYAEWQAGVQPTYEWMNFFGQATLPDGTPVPTGTLVLAVDPGGTVCGATVVWQAGQFGLLACYGDDPQTGVDEGAVPGDTIQLLLEDGTLIGTGPWTAPGGRWEVGQEAQPMVDLAIAKQVMPQAAYPGEAVTYTLTYWNAGSALAQGVVLSDVVPAEIGSPIYTYSGAIITPTAGFVWQVADLEPGAGGIITVTGILSPALVGPLTVTNTAVVDAPLEALPENNVAEALLHVLEGLASLWRLIVRSLL